MFNQFFRTAMQKADVRVGTLDHLAIRTAVIEVQREAIIRLRDDGIIGDQALRLVERDLDLEVLRTGV